MHSIAVAGHLCVDVTPYRTPSAHVEPGRLVEIGPLNLGLGGCVANTARALTALGLTVRVYTTVGNDDLGAFVIQSMAQQNGFLGTPQVVAGTTTSYSLVLEPPGADRTIWHHIGANSAFTGTTIELDTDLLHIGYPSLLPRLLTDEAVGLVDLLSRVRAAGITTSVDMAVIDPHTEVGQLDWRRILQRILPLTDVFSPSVDDLVSALGISDAGSPGLLDQLTDQVLDWGVAIAAVSAGPAGLLLRTASAERLRDGGRVLSNRADQWSSTTVRRHPFSGSPIVTTNGAGDTSTAGLLYALATGADPDTAATTAAAAAAAILAGRTPTPETLLSIAPELDALFPHPEIPAEIPAPH